MNVNEAAAWLRLDHEEREAKVINELTVPTWSDVKRELARRENEALDVVLTFVEETP